MNASPAPLPETEVARRLASLPAWKRQDRELVRELRVAEKMDHHPDLLVSWKRVTVRLTSHDAGGITPRDFALAERIDKLCPPSA